MDYREVAKHNNAESCWVVLYGNVYDVTEFLPEHPGGSQIILKLAGKDATEEYDPVHPPGTLEDNLKPEAKLGEVNAETLPREEKPVMEQNHTQWDGPPPLQSILNLDEIEGTATKMLSPKAWAYYYSGGDDLISKRLNNEVYKQILLRPRVFVDCTECDTSTTLVGEPVKLPVFVSPAAMARLAHPSGEYGIAQACAKYGAAQMISNNASMTPEQITADAQSGQVFGWQLYVQNDRTKSEAMLTRIAKIPSIKCVVLTLDAPVPGKREDDERSKNVGANLPVRSAIEEATAVNRSAGDPQKDGRADAEGEAGGLGKFLFAGTAADLTWKTTLPWLAKHTTLPIILKGIQTHEDAYIASQYAPQIKGIILSNHGGRAVDTAPPSIHTLLEIRKFCPEVFQKLDVYLDGGIKRGTDVVKALCLGAKAVGIGRAALFGLTVGGPAGVERVLEILQTEIETCMRLLGVARVEDLGLPHVNVRALERDIWDGPFGTSSTWSRSSKL